ncbi:unnamed protein product, partial [Staurois parvus]
QASGQPGYDRGTGSPGIRSFGLPAGHRVTSIGCLASTAGIGSPGMTAGTGVTRHQVIWLASMGTALSGKAVGTGVTRVTALDRLGYDSGHRVTRHQVNLARRGAPRHLGKGSGQPESQVRQRALSQLARTAGTGSGTGCIWINSGHRVNW